MRKYWVSWWSGNYADEGCTKPPFKFWVSGQKARPNNGMSDADYKTYISITDEDESEDFLNEHYKDDCSICALIESDSEDAIWELVSKHFPDYAPRFCDEREADFDPSVGGRFL
jgi:hypothetical protein